MKLTKKKYKMDQMAKDCYLRSKQESTNLRNILKKQCRNYKYVKTPADHGLCLYESILISAYEWLNQLPNFEKYISVHLNYDILMFIINNFDNTQLLSEIMIGAIAEAMLREVSLKAWILYLHSEKWGDCTTLLELVSHMWSINFTVINFSGNLDSPLLLFGTHSDSKDADAYIIYNGSTHYMGTGDLTLLAYFLFYLFFLAAYFVSSQSSHNLYIFHCKFSFFKSCSTYGEIWERGQETEEVVKGGHTWYDETAGQQKRPAQGKAHAGLNSVSGEDVREHSAKR